MMNAIFEQNTASGQFLDNLKEYFSSKTIARFLLDLDKVFLILNPRKETSLKKLTFIPKLSGKISKTPIYPQNNPSLNLPASSTIVMKAKLSLNKN